MKIKRRVRRLEKLHRYDHLKLGLMGQRINALDDTAGEWRQLGEAAAEDHHRLRVLCLTWCTKFGHTQPNSGQACPLCGQTYEAPPEVFLGNPLPDGSIPRHNHMDMAQEVVTCPGCERRRAIIGKPNVGLVRLAELAERVEELGGQVTALYDIIRDRDLALTGIEKHLSQHDVDILALGHDITGYVAKVEEQLRKHHVDLFGLRLQAMTAERGRLMQAGVACTCLMRTGPDSPHVQECPASTR